MRQLQLRLFGPLEARLDGAVITQFEAATARGLLAYLAIERAHSQPRTTLATLLWGADAGATGMTNLRSCLRRVRTALGDEANTPSLLQITQDAICLDPQAVCWVDVHAFEALLAQVKSHAHHRLLDCPWCMARLAEAVALYRGPFLDGLSVNSVGFEEWRYLRQERLHRLAMQALYGLADYHHRRGAYPEAEQFARRQITLEPWNEEAHQQLMRILQATGQRSAALAQYQSCQRLLRQHLDVEPLPETRAFYDEIRQQGSSRPNSPNMAFGAERDKSPGLRHNLPRFSRVFLGREQELDLLLERLVNPNQRLVTLVGEGGVGKTRLALAAAQTLLGSFGDGVWYISLAGLESSDDELCVQDAVAGAIVEALGLPLSKRQPPRMEAPSLLRSKEMLLVLDNFEHLLTAAPWVKQLCYLAPHLTFLITSRQRLNLQSEFVVRLQGLPVPDAGDPGSRSQSAVQLFAQCAAQRWPSFQLHAADMPAVVQICQTLRGLPLGIELAAALVSHMTPAQIAAGLSNGLDLLATTQPDAPDRQRSMAAVFDYSWQLLSTHERDVLVAMTVFRGGFRREAGCEITGATPLMLAELYEKALLQQDASGRYELHELLRQFVEKKATGQLLARVRASHSAYYLTLLSRHQRELRGHAMDQAVAVVRAELDNIRRAWHWTVEHRHVGLMAESAGDLRYVCHLLGLWQEGAHLLSQAAACLLQPSLAAVAQQGTTPPATLALAAVLRELAEILSIRGEYAGVVEVTQRLIKLGRSTGLEHLRAAGHLLRGKAWLEQGQLAQSRRRLTVALALAQRSGLVRLEADALFSLGSVAHYQGEKPHAHARLEQALTLYRQLGERLEEANVLSALSQVYHNDPGKVYQFTAQRLELARRVGSAVDEFRALHRLSLLWLNVGDYARAQECCQQALQLAQSLNSSRYATFVLDFLGLTHHYLGDDLTALRYLDQTAHLCEANGDQRGLAYALHWKGQVLLARGELTNAADCYAQAADIRLIHHQPHLAIQSQAGLARVRQAQGRLNQAMALIAPIVDQLDDLRRSDVEDPCMLWLNCYLVLRANGDGRASAVLDQAHTIVQERAARISDTAMRQTFLQNVVYNRQIIEAWQADLARKLKASEEREARGGESQRRAFATRSVSSLPLSPNPMSLAPLAQLPASA